MKTATAAPRVNGKATRTRRSFAAPKRAAAKTAVTKDVRDFLSASDLSAEFEDVLKHLKKCFVDSTAILVELVESHDEPGGEPRILFNVKSGSDDTEFDQQREAFYAPLRDKRPRIYFYIALMRDF